jgi:hypothetical protein
MFEKESNLSIKLKKVEKGMYTLPDELQQHPVELSPEYKDYLRRLHLRGNLLRYVRAMLHGAPKAEGG